MLRNTKLERPRMMRRLPTMLLMATIALSDATAAHAADLRVLASNGVKAAVEELKPQLEKASGSTLSIDFSTAAALRERIEKGEAFDVAILTDDAMAALVKAGKLSPMLTKLARVGIGVGFPEGAARPDVRTPAAIKQSLLNPKAAAHTRDGASRPAIDRMIEPPRVAKRE